MMDRRNKDKVEWKLERREMGMPRGEAAGYKKKAAVQPCCLTISCIIMDYYFLLLLSSTISNRNQYINTDELPSLQRLLTRHRLQ